MDTATVAINCVTVNSEAVAHRTLASTPSSSTSGCVSGDDTSEGKITAPSSLITAENYLTLCDEPGALSSAEDLARAVDRCKEMVLDSRECSEERQWLVRRLIELRLRQQEQKEAGGVGTPEMRVALGHHFVLQSEPAPTARRHCDRCCGIIWGVLHSWYQCCDCKYSCHVKCLPQVCRVCAHVRACENPSYVTDICPETGLSTQGYRCAECKAHITFKNSWVEPRLCDYDGQYYCPGCHWNSTAVIPARVVHNWDFEERKVCRASRQLLKLMFRSPVIRLEALNPRLFAFVEELSVVKKLRENILLMKKYLILCKDASESRLLGRLGDRLHFTESLDAYSLQDLVELHSGQLLGQLESVEAAFASHIRTDCKLCYGRGYVCELCEDKEVIFPFDSCTATCPACHTVFHKTCWTKKNHQCPKCVRLEKRASLHLDKSRSDEEDVP
ncbi:differentially expressed in FDCP 8 homolog isoform X2 [Bacillus rossius redtenbacheri]|uniref:differentially expressed in FDCP 8 homolog isoform X2 n=1 Tax=Bacillus rossius redtenbacheri TaxID=93214 RepID=UPI002FDDEA95